MSPRYKLLSLALPPVAALLVERVFWNDRNQLADFGVGVDALAMHVALFVAVAMGAAADLPAGPRSTLVDGLLHRLACGGFGLLAAALCVFTFASTRLKSLVVSPVVAVTGMGAVAVFVLLLTLVFGVGGAALARVLFCRSGHAARAAVAAAAILLAGVLTLAGRDAPLAIGPRSEPVVLASPLVLPFAKAPITLNNRAYEYVAIGGECAFKAVKTESGLNLKGVMPVAPVSVENGFSVCPAIELRKLGSEIFALAPELSEGKLLFKISGPDLVGFRMFAPNAVFGAVAEQAALDSQKAEPFSSVPGLRAPVARYGDVTEGDGVSVTRDASPARMRTQCSLAVMVDGVGVHAGEPYFVGVETGLELCPAVTVWRSREAELVTLHVEERSWLSGRPEPRSKSWLRGEEVESVGLRAVASAYRSPPEWRLLGRAGALAGATLLCWALAEIVRLRSLRGFKSARHEGDGVVLLDGEVRVEVPAARALPHGSILVRGPIPEASAPPAGYREVSEPPIADLEVREPIAHGVLATHREARAGLAAAAALTVALAGAALPMAAWLFGLGR